MTKLFAIAIPVLTGKKEQLKKFASDLNGRYKKEFNESRKELGVQERTFLQSGPDGDMIIVTLEGENPQDSFKKFSEKNDEFSKWFVAQAKEIHGIDLTQKPPFTSELLTETEPVSENVLK